MIQRSVKPLTRWLSSMTMKAPRTGPASVPAPPMMTISVISAEITMPTDSGLTKPL